MAWNPRYLRSIASDLGGDLQVWDYDTIDAMAAIVADGYFATAREKGLRVGDRVYVRVFDALPGRTTLLDHFFVGITAMSAGGAATGVVATQLNPSPSVLNSLGIGPNSSPQFESIRLGHASDTLLERLGPGRPGVNGDELATQDFVNTALATSSSGSGALLYATKALLDADLAHDAGTSAWVYADATEANNGVYTKTGASGAGSWTRILNLPGRPSPLRLTSVAGGTTMTASCSNTPSTGDFVQWQAVADNDGSAMTLAVNGAAAVPVHDQWGHTPIKGMIRSGQLCLGYRFPTTLRLIERALTRDMLAISGAPVYHDPTNVLGGGVGLYLPRKVLAREAGATLNTIGTNDLGTDSVTLPGWTFLATPSSTTDYIVYIDPAAAAGSAVVITSTLGNFLPGQHVFVAEVLAGRVRTALPVVRLDDALDKTRVLLRGPLVVVGTELLIPAFYFVAGATATLVSPASGESHHRVTLSSASTAQNRHFYDPFTNSLRTVGGSTAPTFSDRLPLIAITMNYTVLYGAAQAIGRNNVPPSRNQFQYGLRPDLAPYLFPNSANVAPTAEVVAITDATLLGLGFTLGVRTTNGNNAAFYGGSLAETATGFDYFFARIYVQTTVADNFGGSHRLYLRANDGAWTATHAANLVLEQKLSSTAAIYSASGRIAVSPIAPYQWSGFHAGCFNTAGAGHVIVTGAQVAVGKAPIPWIERDDYRDHEAPGMSPLYGDTLFGIDGMPLPIYGTSLNKRKDDTQRTVYALSSLPASRSVPPLAAEFRDYIEVDTARMGTTATLDASWAGQGQSWRRRKTLAVKRGKATSSGATAKILCIGDSYFDSRLLANIDARLTDRGYAPTWLGTRRTRSLSDGVGAEPTGPYAEARGGRAIDDYLYRTLDGEATPVGIGGEAAYLALDAASKLTYNPFITPAVGGEPYIFNGYVFNFPEYLLRFGVARPDIVQIGLGLNDLLEINSQSAMVSSVAAMVDAMTSSIRAESASIKILYWLHPMPRADSTDEQWERIMSAGIEELIRKVRALADANVDIVPAWAHVATRSWNTLYATPAVNAATGIQTAHLSDLVHPGALGYAQAADLFTAALAAMIDPA